MMRNEQSQQHRLSQGGFGIMAASQSIQSSSDNVLQSIMKKESQYCDGIKANHSVLKSMTQRLCDIQSLLAPTNDDTAKSNTSQSPNNKKNDVFQNTINDQKQIIRNIAKENVIREQYVRTFCDTLKNVRTQQQKELSQQAPATSNNEILSFDYQKAILEGIDSLSRKRNIDQEELIQQDKYYREIADVLGDPKPTTMNQSKQHRNGGKRNGRSIDDDDDDDDIEMTAPAGGVSQIQQLKCPVTREYMIDAVENMVCHHVYSRKGIMSYMEQNISAARRGGYHLKNACPVVGCGNRQISAEQLQDHHEISMMSRREIRRQDMRKEQQQMSSNGVLMDSDEE
jgi:Zinc-finger of the MIZ type in Nse subunit